MSYELIQQSVRASTGTSGTYEEDWHALFDADGVASGFFNDRMLAWINTTLGTSYAFLADAMKAYAVDQGYSTWAEMGTISFSPTPALDLPFSTYSTLADLTAKGVTFSRPSLATMIDSTGKLTYCPNNLVKYSQDATNAVWKFSNTNVHVADQTANPLNGVVDADLLREDTSTGIHRTYYYEGVNSTAGAYTIVSLYVKAAGRTKFEITCSNIGATTGTVDLTAGTVTGGTWVLVDAGSGWFRLYARGVAAAVSTSWFINFSNGSTTSYTGDGASGIYAFGHQIEAVTYETLPRAYTATTSSAYYGPRFDYDPATLAARGLLIEEARTNLTTYSQDFSNAAWTKNGGSITATVTSPDGTANASTFTANGLSDNIHGFTRTYTTTADTDYANTVFVEAGTGPYILLSWANVLSSDSYVAAVFNLTAGTVSQTSVGSTSGTIARTSITSVGNGRYRIELAGKHSGTNTRLIIGLAPAASGNTFTSSGRITATQSTTFSAMGHQLEAGSFATSYIPTGSAAVARSADSVSMTGSNFSSWYNASEGTFVFTWQRPQKAFGYILSAYLSTASTNQVSVRDDTSGNIESYIRTVTGGVTFQQSIINPMVVNTSYNMATAYAVNDSNSALNGTAKTTDTTVDIPDGAEAPNTFTIGSTSGGSYLNGHIKSIKYYNTRLPDATLQSLTA